MSNWDLESEEFQENEVWDLMSTNTNTSSNDVVSSKPRKIFSTGSTSSTNRFTNPRSVPRSNNSGSLIRGQNSAPVEIPDWSKILKKKTTTKDTCHDNHVVDDDADDDMVPPHEYLAKRLQSTKIASYSMCEGVGRTLKGRDLSKLRNAILTKTGFLE